MEKAMEETKEVNDENRGPGNITYPLEITYFTDPLCCWSWGFQPHIDRLQNIYTDQINIRYVMGGMIPAWDKFHDEVHAVNRPAQMGPLWMHAAQLTGRPINYLLWIKDPPSGSFPACIAVKCAELQSPVIGKLFFNAVQAAAMMREKNIASWNVLEEIARELAANYSDFDLKQFIAQRNEGAELFRDDLDIIARHKISRFPTLLVESPGRKSIIISGYRTFDAVEEALKTAFK